MQQRTQPVMTHFVRTVMTIMGIIGVSRGVDYVTGNSNDLGRWVDDDLTMPEVWGAACLVCGALVLAAAAVKSASLAINSCILSFAVSLTLAIQIWDWRMWVVPWPPEDIRMATDHVGHAAIFMAVAVTVWYRVGKAKRAREIVEQRENERQASE